MTMDTLAFMTKLENRFGFTPEDKFILKSNADWGLEIASEMADYFYGYLGRDAEMNAILNQSEGRIHRLRETFILWFHEMFTGIDDWGAGYSQRRWQIGVVHVKVGIGPQHIVPAMATVVHEVGKKLKIEGKSEELQEALGRICMIDLAFIEQSYVEVSTSAILKETGWSAALFKRLITTGAASM
ncbi:protoglobin domain-containing protein [Trichormus sp. NMC-1]|uniref:protoglobin domain-containing protein n=1 Tax=Trichormus sp. NMC-1 TaxID=1853259 RepID=UPI0008DC0F00|nr:protoglobin domain-containing protein [Trichormus sp. NMC-1]